MEEYPASRKQALEDGVDRYFTGRPCKNGHIAFRWTDEGKCSECRKEYRRKTYLRNKDAHAKRCAQWREQNREAYSSYMKKRYRQRREQVLDYQKDRYWADREDYLKKQRARQRANKAYFKDYNSEYYENNKHRIAYNKAEWKRKNKAKNAEMTRRYQAAKLRAMPRWVSQAELLAIYEQSTRLTRETKIVHHVDHIIPLQGSAVCGLHVPWNLQIITATENLKKSNKVI